MSYLMCKEGGFSTQKLSTLIAFTGFLPYMNSLMYNEGGLLRKGFPTLISFPFSMYPLLCNEDCPFEEGFPTFIILKKFFHGVNDLMQSKIFILTSGFPNWIIFVFFHSRMIFSHVQNGVVVFHIHYIYQEPF